MIFFASFCVMLFYSVSPTVYSGDSGLFSAAGFFMGSAHPPSYPLLIMLEKLFTFLPFGSIAFKTNVLSALFASLAAVLAYEASYLLTENRLASLLAPVAALSSPLLILESSKAEAYSLNALLVMLVFYLCIRALRSQRCRREILLAVFVAGLGMGNHQSIGFAFPLIAAAALIRRRSLSPSVILACLAVLAAGLSVYAYLYLRTMAQAGMSYVRVYSFEDMLITFFRTGYGPGSTVNAVAAVGENAPGWWHALGNLARILRPEVPLVAAIFALAGLAASLRDRKLFAMLAFSLLIWLPLAKITLSMQEPTNRQLSIVSPYFVQVPVIIAVMSSFGLAEVRRAVGRFSAFVAAGLAVCVLAFQGIHVPQAIQKSSLSDYYISYAWIRSISSVMKPGSVYFASGDNPVYLSFYGLGVERTRDDILVLNSLSGAGVFDITLAPAEKFSVLHQKLYENPELDIDSLVPAAMKGRVYANSGRSVAEEIAKKLLPHDYVLTAVLLPEGSEFPLEENFRKAFEKIDYLPVVLGHKKDYLTSEINNNFAVTIFNRVNLAGGVGKEEAEYYMKLAYLLGSDTTKLVIIRDHMYGIADTEGEAAAEAFLENLKVSIKGEKAIGALENALRTKQ